MGQNKVNDLLKLAKSINGNEEANDIQSTYKATYKKTLSASSQVLHVNKKEAKDSSIRGLIIMIGIPIILVIIIVFLNLSSETKKYENEPKRISSPTPTHSLNNTEINYLSRDTPYELAIKYYDGEGVEKNLSEAYKYALLGSQQNDASCINLLGYMYYNGEGTKKDLQKAIHYWNEGVRLENPISRYNLALRYLKGEGVNKDESRAIELLIQSAEQGFAEAQLELAFIFHSGIGTKVDLPRAMQYALRAANQGLSAAQRMVAQAYLEGSHGVRQDIPESIRWNEKAAEAMDLDALVDLGIIYYSGEYIPQNLSMARMYFVRAYSHPIAQLYLGNMAYKGEGEDKNIDNAKRWWEKSAKQGNKDAMENLKLLHESADE